MNLRISTMTSASSSLQYLQFSISIVLEGRRGNRGILPSSYIFPCTRSLSLVATIRYGTISSSWILPDDRSLDLSRFSRPWRRPIQFPTLTLHGTEIIKQADHIRNQPQLTAILHIANNNNRQQYNIMNANGCVSKYPDDCS